jgi:predicted aldo/keto reductase-like oxidoreductase
MKGNEVDIEQTKQMVDLFMGKGFTYFDTAYGYIEGKTEEAAKVVLVDRYPRESFQLATKMAAWAGPKTAKVSRPPDALNAVSAKLPALSIYI